MPLSADGWYSDESPALRQRKPVVRLAGGEHPVAWMIPSGLPATALAFLAQPNPVAPRRPRFRAADPEGLRVFPQSQDVVAVITATVSVAATALSAPTNRRTRLWRAQSMPTTLLIDDAEQQINWRSLYPDKVALRPPFHAASAQEPSSELVATETWYAAVQVMAPPSRPRRPTRPQDNPIEMLVVADERASVLFATGALPGDVAFPGRRRPVLPEFSPGAAYLTADPPLWTAAFDAQPAPSFRAPRLKPSSWDDGAAPVTLAVVTDLDKMPADWALQNPSPHFRPAPLMVMQPMLTLDAAQVSDAAAYAGAWSSATGIFRCGRLDAPNRTGPIYESRAEPEAAPSWQASGVILISGPYWCEAAMIFVPGAEMGGVFTG